MRLIEELDKRHQNNRPQLWGVFTWDKYIKSALRWVDCRNDELSKGLAAHGGVEIIDDLVLQPLPKTKKRSVRRCVPPPGLTD
jgi:hypothetical protein